MNQGAGAGAGRPKIGGSDSDPPKKRDERPTLSDAGIDNSRRFVWSIMTTTTMRAKPPYRSKIPARKVDRAQQSREFFVDEKGAAASEVNQSAAEPVKLY
jgi:hypothetical protein